MYTLTALSIVTGHYRVLPTNIDSFADLLQRGAPQIANAGTAGRATGNHNHFEIAKGKFTHKYDLNQKNKVYHLPNSISADKCCFVDKTDIINGNNMKWKHL